MEAAALKVALRECSGKGLARKVRKAGMIPAVLYGPEQKPVTLQIHPSWLNLALKGGRGRYTLLELQTDGEDTKKINGKIAHIKDLQYHAYRPDIIHMDLFQIPAQREIIMPVPLQIVGQPSILAKDYILQPLIDEVNVRCFIADLPSQIIIDVEGMTPNQSVRISSLPVPPKVQIMHDSNQPVVVFASKGKEGPAPGAAAAAEEAPKEEVKEPKAKE